MGEGIVEGLLPLEETEGLTMTIELTRPDGSAVQRLSATALTHCFLNLDIPLVVPPAQWRAVYENLGTEDLTTYEILGELPESELLGRRLHGYVLVPDVSLVGGKGGSLIVLLRIRDYVDRLIEDASGEPPRALQAPRAPRAKTNLEIRDWP